MNDDWWICDAVRRPATRCFRRQSQLFIYSHMETWSWNIFKMGVTGWRSGLFMAWWIIINVGVFIVGFLEQRNDPGLFKLNDPIGNSVFVSRGAGLVLMMQGMLILLPVCRNLLALMRQVKLFRYVITWDKNIHFHKIVAWTMAAFTAVHVIAHCFNFAIVQDKLTIMKPNNSAVFLLWNHPGGYTGVIMLVCMFLIYTTALPPIRRHCFELFWYTHHMAAIFMLALCAHSAGCFVKRAKGDCKPYGTWTVAVAGIIIYALERILRELRSRRLTYITKIVKHPGNTVELQFKKDSFSYLAGQYIFICIPMISKAQWHPFTITSCPEEDYVSVHIRVVGDWTRALSDKLDSMSYDLQSSSSKLPTLRVDGPFGAPSQEFYDYETIVLVGAGIGVTPFASILKSLWFKQKVSSSQTGLKVKKCYFFWICRDTQAFEWFQSLLEAIEYDTSDGFIEIHTYLTGGLKLNELSNISVQADSPVDPITRLKSRTKFGRPNFNAFFQTLRETQSSRNTERKDVGVFYCGPDALRKTLRKAANVNSTSDFIFDFHPEKF